MLDQRKTKALELLQRGNTVTSICQEIGIGRTTFYKWLKGDKDFIKAKETLENELVNGLTSVALLEAEELLLNGTSTEKIQIIQQILKLRAKQDINLNVKKDVITLDQMLAKVKI